ncbi:tRNA (adenine(58)-N(1))-methyltransferase catalytic subunit TRMT61A-like [Gigantopelta aegis]|uniref:tRNA (adenine(58)-N(1))-methyltransferase catalytic subunit TRMT61A-like n=1 Tax=Gigantopelta aegis TaxID=1735272 RepID=UPI001B88D49F|nr:tRNA (adenine(58)-N(1))-methyltransferase catalytic subunit TRMT61A-like [Gigantopelta aegis]
MLGFEMAMLCNIESYVPCKRNLYSGLIASQYFMFMMSFAKYNDKIEEGNIVIVYLNHDNMHSLKVTRGQTHQTRFGALKHSDLIGVRFGSKIVCNKGWLYILFPTPELWTLAVPHRTQILYSTDISMILMQLDLKPGAVVIEAGTGSGSLSHAIIQSVMPTGHLFTFEFHEERAKKATVEFVDHGLADYVTVACRDVCQRGFPHNGEADAVFLDLPSPWECIQSAKQALKKSGGRICTFSPCIEQVQKSCESLTSHGFQEVNTLECLVRNFSVRNFSLPTADLGQTESSDLQPAVKHLKMETSPSATLQEDTKNVSASKSPDSRKSKSTTEDCFSFSAGVPPINMQGHTGFLTFATLYPSL